MIADTIVIFERIAHALFDTGASPSFIFATYVKMFEFAVGILDEPIYVVISVERSLVTDQM